MIGGLGLTAMVLTTISATKDLPAVRVHVDFAARQGSHNIDMMALGQGGLSPAPMWDSRIAEVRSIRPAIIRLFVQEYFRVMPKPGKYDFRALDRSVDTILRTGAKPLMCICFKPPALFPKIDQDVVEPNDYAAWEKLIHALVKHYHDRGAGILYWEIANEPDIGEDGGCPYRFQPASYVRYYRHTATAIRQADRGALIGGPALANYRSQILPALLDACAKEHLPLDFVSWHAYTSDPKHVRHTIEYVHELLKKHPALHVETMLDEWNMDLSNPPRDARFQPCYLLETIWQMKDAGLSGSCYYHIRDFHVERDDLARFMSERGAAFMRRWWNSTPQFDGLFDFQNNIRPAYFAFKLLARLRGGKVPCSSNDTRVHGFAVHDDVLAIDNLLLWNFSSEPLDLTLDLDGLSTEKLMRAVTLDAVTADSDENARLRPDAPAKIDKGAHRLRVTLEPYGVKFWSFE